MPNTPDKKEWVEGNAPEEPSTVLLSATAAFERQKTDAAQSDRLQPLLKRVRQLVDGIRAGQFPVVNEDEDCTHGCALNTICRVAHIRSLEKQWV